MKLHFDGVSANISTGPNCFAHRLQQALTELGHEIVLNDGTNCDLSLVFIEKSGAKLANKVIQRLDGFWCKPSEFLHKNSGILGLYGKADGVIFQSAFDKRFIYKHWDLHKNNAVIHNGIKQVPITKFTATALEEIRTKYKKVFVCSANWHPQKRLAANIQLFEHIQRTIEPNSCLMIMGNSPDVRKASKDIFYTGSLSEKLCLEVYSMADWMLCLEYLPHCPNVVVECLSQQTPVICSSLGGASELVQNFGLLIDEKEEFKYQLTDYDLPPDIDIKIKNLPDKNSLGQCPNHDIVQTAEKYISFFKTVL